MVEIMVVQVEEVAEVLQLLLVDQETLQVHLQVKEIMVEVVLVLLMEEVVVEVLVQLV
jgi:hypothetical protein